MDPNHIFGAEFRQVLEREHDGKPARVVILARTYATQQDDLWDALTNPDRLPRWFLPVTGDLKPGGQYQLEGNASGTILRCTPPELIDITWEFLGKLSWVVVRLSPDKDGTRLSLEHIALKDEAGEEFWAQYGPAATGIGWDLSFRSLSLYLDGDGMGFNYDKHEAWMESEDGKSFMRKSSDDWTAVHIAAGETPDIARSMASRTAKFYTGE